MTEPSETPDGHQALILAVTSGKGGVGKTSFATNLGAELAGRGHRTVLLDADLGLANAHILLGTQPRKTFKDYIEGRAEVADIIQEGPGGLKLLSGGGGEADLADLDERGTQRMREAVQILRPYCDVILLDTGAGVGRGVTDFIHLADRVLVITTSDFTAVADAYGIIKVIHQQGYTRPIHMVVNRAHSPEEASQVFKKMCYCTEKFLKLNIQWLGLVPEDVSVNKAIQKRSPFLLAFPESAAARFLKQIAGDVEKMMTATLATR